MKVAFLLLSTAKLALAFEGDCPNVTVIHDVVEDSWYGGCLGLSNSSSENTVEKCANLCKSVMTCNVWQLTKTACWTGGTVQGCRSRGSDAALGNFEEDLVAGQRIQHGFIKVLDTNSKIETMGLMHYPMKTGTPEEQIKRCKMDCYTTVSCTVWQYGADGCWVEHLPKNPKKGTTTESDWAKGMITGETIEHTCPPYVPEDRRPPWEWIITGIILALAALASIIYLLRRKPKVKKTRAVKIVNEAKKEDPVVYLMPQPTVFLPQPSVLMPQPMMPPVMQAAPQYTVQAAPQYTVLQ